MNISQILFNKNNVKIKDLIPITEFKTVEDIKNKLNFSGCDIVSSNGSTKNLFMTEDEFFKKYENLKSKRDNLYYNGNSFLYDNAVVYLDMNYFILIDLTNHFVFSESNTNNCQTTILDFIKKLEEDYNNDRYIYLLYQIPDAFKLEMLENLINSKDIIDDNLYSAFMDYYNMTDFGFNSITKNTIQKLFSNKSEQLKLETLNNLSELPEEIIVYRGQGDKSTNYKDAYSWSIMPNVAIFFALRYIEKEGQLIVGKVKKSDIIEFFDGTEQEVIVHPNSVKDIKVYDFYTLNGLNKYLESTLSIYGSYKYILNTQLDFINDDLEHGKLHSLRVLLYSLVLGKLKGLNESNLHLLSLASIYHDIGRIDNSVDDFHGLRSREIYERDNNVDDDVVKFLIEYHCIDDNIALQTLADSNIQNKDEAKELLFILKDADALDRLRFGLYGLDFTYLRNVESIRMILFAKFAIKSITL